MPRCFSDLDQNEEEWTRAWKITRLILLVREPTSLFAYWEIDDFRKEMLSEHFRQAWSSLPLFIRLHDVTDIMFDGHNAHVSRSNQIHQSTDNWYFHNVQPDRHYIADICTISSDNSYFTILRSNSVGTPPKYLESRLESKIRFSKPALKDNKQYEDLDSLLSTLPANWRKDFTGYNLVQNKKGR
jgi:hypothetical protein